MGYALFMPIASQVLRALDARDHVILLDERGKDISSEDLARVIGSAGDRQASICQAC